MHSPYLHARTNDADEYRIVANRSLRTILGKVQRETDVEEGVVRRSMSANSNDP